MIHVLKLFSRLPMPFLYGVSSIIYVLAYYVLGYRKKVVRENIEKTFPDKTPKEQEKLIRDFYRHLSDVVVETMKAITISKEFILKRVKIRNPEALEAKFAQERAVLVMTSHQCNWEWLLLGCGAYFEKPMDGLYKPLRNKQVDALMLDVRSRFGGKPIAKNDALREIARRSKTARAIGIVADQVPGEFEKKYWTTFLGRETSFFLGTQRIAQLTKCPVMFVGMRKLKRGYYEIFFEELAEPPYEKDSFAVLEAYARAAEKLVSEAPQHWLWSHKRWKYEKV